ncbi:MAG: 30S ribosomal protein S18 [Candidatus Magasanikbacteria bacterium CG_4_10_14_0_2_um_filter_37_12]|uniref:Small ribosomal subunit protein bS18 n=1 Tax=Candidatus Magasanikbacteria bacterium CG_4_10_14_0_2_um_filter_37_12 TaxID=1974637 RepID=A0A2M7V720_9BACT|nr:MAG: 30S ribosomal protein S18 [Candidatus Magasanikbacteria bacterium CG_4_10_14_0_2_um_filter_37_12]
MQTKKTENTDKQCYFCLNNIVEIDYKDVQTLRRFVSSYMKIAPRRRSGLCANHQRKVARAVKQSRIAGLMAFVPK